MHALMEDCDDANLIGFTDPPIDEVASTSAEIALDPKDCGHWTPNQSPIDDLLESLDQHVAVRIGLRPALAMKAVIVDIFELNDRARRDGNFAHA